MSILEYVRDCSVCSGKGEYPQRYTAGCGMGYFTSLGDCDRCKKTGLVYKASGEAVPKSVVAQYRAAKEKEAEYWKERNAQFMGGVGDEVWD